MEFSRPEYWSAQPFPSPGDLSNPEIEPRSPSLQVDSLPAEPPGKSNYYHSLLLFFLICHLLNQRKLENKEYLPPVTTKRDASCRSVPGIGSSNVMHKVRMQFYALTWGTGAVECSGDLQRCTGERLAAQAEGQAPGWAACDHQCDTKVCLFTAVLLLVHRPSRPPTSLAICQPWKTISWAGSGIHDVKNTNLSNTVVLASIHGV